MDIFAFQNIDLGTFSISKMLIMKNIVIKNLTKLFLIKILFGNRSFLYNKKRGC